MPAGALVVAVLAAFTMTMFITLTSLSLGGEQVADRDLGRYGAFVGFGSVTVPPGDTTALPLLERSAIDGGAADAEIALVAPDVQITHDPNQVWTLTEARWAAEPFPRRYSLVAGQWPRRAGEVAISDPAPGSPVVGESVALFGGAQRVEVVGHAADQYATDPSILAGPGTWAGLPADIGENFAAAQAQPVLFWAGNEVDRVTQSFARAVATLENGAPEVVAASLRTRDQLIEQPEMTWLHRSPAGYRIPSVVLPLLAVAVLFGASFKHLRRALAIMQEVGVRRRDAVLAAGLAVAGWALTAALLGSTAGLGVGLAVRSIVRAVRDRPAGPVDNLLTPMVTGLVVTALAVAAGSVVLSRSLSSARQGREEDAAPPSSGLGTRHGGALRRTLGACVLIATAAAVPAVNTPARAGWLSAALTVGVLLMLPEVVAASLRLFPERGPRARLARRQMLRDRTSIAAAVGMTTFLLSASLGYMVLFSSLVASLNTANHPDVLPGQVLVQDRGSLAQPPPRSALAAVEESGAVRREQGAALGYTLSVNAQGDATTVATVVGTGGTLISVEDEAAVRGLLSRSLTAEQDRALNAGAVLLWDPAAETDDGVVVEVTRVDSGQSRRVTIDGLTVDPPRAGWSAGSSGILLAAAAERIGLPVTSAPVMFFGLDERQVEAIRQAVVERGVDASTVLVPRDPPPVIPNAGFVLTVAGLAVLAVLGVVVSTRSQARSLRGYLAQLGSLGLPRRWTSAVLLYQVGHVAVVSTVLGTAIAVPPVLAVAMNIPGLTVDIPYREVLILTSTVYAATCLAALAAAHRVSTRLHLQEA